MVNNVKQYAVQAHEVQKLLDLMESVKRGATPAGFHSVEIEPGVGMLVEPINGPPYVFQLPSFAHVFEYQAGSGTDKLRQRIDAGLFFFKLVESTRAQSEVEAEGAEPQRPVRNLALARAADQEITFNIHDQIAAQGAQGAQGAQATRPAQRAA